MNTLSAQYYRTKFTNAPHLVMVVDGIPLNKLMEKANYDGHLEGLVPTMLKGWLDNKKEEKVVEDRLALKPKSISIAPILMCPDDCDFSCTVIVAEMRLEKNTVRWNKLGIDQTPTRVENSQTAGRNVIWLNNIGPFEFTKQDFEDCINTFKNEK